MHMHISSPHYVASFKFELLRRKIKEDVRKPHDLYIDNLVGDEKAQCQRHLSVYIYTFWSALC